jgi:hypothetical protein
MEGIYGHWYQRSSNTSNIAVADADKPAQLDVNLLSRFANVGDNLSTRADSRSIHTQ